MDILIHALIVFSKKLIVMGNIIKQVMENVNEKTKSISMFWQMGLFPNENDTTSVSWVMNWCKDILPLHYHIDTMAS